MREPIEELIAEHSGFGVLRALLLCVLMDVGELGESRDGFEAEAEARFTGDAFYAVPYLCGMALICARLADSARADILTTLLQPYRNQFETTAGNSVLSTSACLGMLAALLGREDDADRYFAEAIDLAKAFRYPFMMASAQLEWARALLDRSTAEQEPAETLLHDALTTARQYGFAGIQRGATDLEARLERA